MSLAALTAQFSVDTHYLAYGLPVCFEHGVADRAEHHFMAVFHVARRVRVLHRSEGEAQERFARVTFKESLIAG